MREIVYFKICDNEEKYKKIRQCKITKYKLFNSILKHIYHYKFIIMSKFNMMQRIIDNKKQIYIIYQIPQINEEKVLKNINNMIVKMTYKNKNVRIILSKQIKSLIKEKNMQNTKELYNILQNSIDSKVIYKDFLNETVTSIIKLRKETPEEQSIYVLLNSDNFNYINLLNKMIPNYKMSNIVTQNINKFKEYEKKAEEKFELVSVLNNKKKSITRAKYIINIDFEEKDLINYCINRTAIIFNISNTKIENLKNFDGIIINNINIDKSDGEFTLKDEYIENKLYTEEILKSIKNYNYELEGNNGKIQFKEIVTSCNRRPKSPRIKT